MLKMQVCCGGIKSRNKSFTARVSWKAGITGRQNDDPCNEVKISLQYLYDRFGHGYAREIYNIESHCPDTWTQKRTFAFVICFLGLVVFPWGAKEEIHTRLIMVADALFNGIDGNLGTIVPMILADIYRSLSHCKDGARHFEGCNLLLQIWLIEHL